MAEYVEHAEGDGVEMFKAVCKLGLEGWPPNGRNILTIPSLSPWIEALRTTYLPSSFINNFDVVSDLRHRRFKFSPPMTCLFFSR